MHKHYDFKISKLTLFNYLSFIVLIFFKAFGDAALANQASFGFNDDIKYVFLLVSTLFCYIQILHRKSIRHYIKNDYINFSCVIAVWLIISFIFYNNTSYPHTESIKYWFYFIFAFLYAGGLFQTTNPKHILLFFKTAFVICFACYIFFEKGMSLFSIENFNSISFTDSFSVFESSYAAGNSVAFCAFFSYYRKNNRIWFYLSCLFCFLTFKRLAILAMLVFIILPYITKIDAKVKQRWIYISIISFIIFTFGIMFCFQTKNITYLENHLNIDISKIFMGRTKLFNMLLESDYKIAGYGTAMDLMASEYEKFNGIELELVQVLMETSVIGLTVLLNFIFKLTHNNRFCFILIIYQAVNLLTSSSLGNLFSWVFTYLTIWSITERNLDKNGN